MGNRRERDGEPQLDCRTCPTLKTAEWRVLSPEQVQRLSAAKHSEHFEANQAVFREGSRSMGVYCIAQGSVMLRKMDANGNALLVNAVPQGRTFGYRAFFNNRQQAVQAETLEPSTICHVPADAMDALLDDNRLLGRHFAASLAHDVKAMEDALVNHMNRPARARLSRLLFLLLDRFAGTNSNDQIVLHLPFSRSQMGELLGMQRETVTRTLNALQDDGVLNQTGRELTIDDLDRLLDEIEQE